MKKPLLILFILIQFGCKQDVVDPANHIIDINLDQLADWFVPGLEIKSIVQLELTDSSIIGGVYGIEMHDRYIYVLDKFKSRAVFVFSEKGDFLGRTKNGKGPGEMINPSAIFLDKSSNLFYAWDQMSTSIFQYDLELEFQHQEVFKNYLINFAVLKNDRTLIHTHYFQDFVYKVIAPDNETIESEFLPDMKYRGTRSNFRSITIHERVLAIAPLRYDIYELKDNDFISVYRFNFGKYELTKDDIEQNSEGLRGVQSLINEGKKVSGLQDISEGESFLTFRVYFKTEELNFAYSLKDKKIYLLNEYFGKNLLPVSSVRGITVDNLFYAIVEPADLDNFQKETGKILIEGEIDLESNPYIITFKLDELVEN